MKIEFSISELEFDVRKYGNYVKVNEELFDKNEAIEMASKMIEAANDILQTSKQIKDKQ